MKIHITLDIPEDQIQATIGSSGFFSSLPQGVQEYLKPRKDIFDAANRDAKALADHLTAILDMLDTTDEYPGSKVPEAIAKLVYYSLRYQASTARLEEYMEMSDEDEEDINELMDVFYSVMECADEFYDQMLNLFDFFTYQVPSEFAGAAEEKAAVEEAEKDAEAGESICKGNEAFSDCEGCTRRVQKVSGSAKHEAKSEPAHEARREPRTETIPSEKDAPEPETSKAGLSSVTCTVCGDITNMSMLNYLVGPEFNAILDSIAKHVMDAMR